MSGREQRLAGPVVHKVCGSLCSPAAQASLPCWDSGSGLGQDLQPPPSLTAEIGLSRQEVAFISSVTALTELRS